MSAINKMVGKAVHAAGQFSKKIFLEQKLQNVAGYFIVAIIAVFFGYLIARQTVLGLGLVGLLIGAFGVILCMLNPELGLYLNIGYSFFSYHFSRLLFDDGFPVGVGSDILVISTFLGVYTRRTIAMKLPPPPVFTILLILYAYIVLEFFNPFAHSFQGWYATFRKIIAEFLLLFIGYNILTNGLIIRRFVKVLFLLCTICGIYGCIQQWHGLFGFELSWAMADEHRFGLMFIAGEFRKMSTFSDPTAFGVLMAASSVFFIILAIAQKSRRTKSVLYGGVLFMLLGMAYSGTRTANAMIVAGLAFFILLTFNKKGTRIFAVVGGFLFLAILYGPFNNPTISRFRTTFSGSDDESYKVRVVNRAFVQPYIRDHPIGGGLGTTGGVGMTYNPSHFLAGFPPDSGYLKYALEMGWIGLAIVCLVYFNIMRNAIRQYFAVADEGLKNLFAGCICFFFCFYVAQFAQDAMGQITDIVVYFPLVAITLRGKSLFSKDEKAGD